MPPFAWVESELRARATDEGRRRATTVGSGARTTLRVSLLSLLADGNWAPVRSLAYQLEHAGGNRRARTVPVRALVRSLEAQGLVEVEDVLTGRSSAFRTARIAAITAAGLSALEALQSGVSAAAGLGPKQRDALAALAGMPAGGGDLASLRDRSVTADVIQRLAARGLASLRTERRDRDPFESQATATTPPETAGHGRHALTAEQQDALDRLSTMAARGSFGTALVHGVTGSGKTEVYLRLAARGSRRRPVRPGARARNRADAGAGRDLPVAVRRAARDSAQRALGRRAARPVAAHPPGGCGRGGGYALGGLRAARVAGPRDRGRRARRLVQAGREPALQRTRRGRRPGAARGRGGGARLRHAIARELSQRVARPLRARRS